MAEVYIVGGIRTPIGKIGGILKNYLPEQLAAEVLNAVIKKYFLAAEDIDQVMLGNVVGPGGNIARVSLLEAGWPYHIPGLTVDFQCGSGLAAINLAINQIMAEQADIIIAGGVESVSLAPKRQFNNNDIRYQGEHVFFERPPFSPSVIGDPEMGEGAENLGRLKNISREAMDQWAFESHQKALAVRKEGLLEDITIVLKNKKNDRNINQDESIRPKISLELLKRMPAVFKENGKITAGNACLKHDGAAMILLASERAVKQYNLKPLAKFTAASFSGVDPNLFPLAPITSIKKLLEKANMTTVDIDAVEINEAFAVKVLACCGETGISLSKTNILGGALAYGHPYGASGAIILLHLLKALKKTNGINGIASIGVGGGQAASILIERLN